MAVGGTILLAIAIVGGGIALSLHFEDPHWVNRSGALVVALEAVIGGVEFARRHRLAVLSSYLTGRLEERPKARNRAGEVLDEAIGRSERNLLTVALILAAAGEVLHGFGDLRQHRRTGAKLGGLQPDARRGRRL